MPYTQISGLIIIVHIWACPSLSFLLPLVHVISASGGLRYCIFSVRATEQAGKGTRYICFSFSLLFFSYSFLFVRRNNQHLEISQTPHLLLRQGAIWYRHSFICLRGPLGRVSQGNWIHFCQSALPPKERRRRGEERSGGSERVECTFLPSVSYPQLALFNDGAQLFFCVAGACWSVLWQGVISQVHSVQLGLICAACLSDLFLLLTLLHADRQ